MKVLLVIIALTACAGCTRATSAEEKPAAAAPAARNGIVVVPPDSPMLKEIARDRVKNVSLPTDELIAPGTIEVNPNHLSKVVLPVAGRVVSVTVKVGDSVKKGQPLLEIQSPDADAAMSAYLSAEAGMSQARAGLVKARADFDRETDLFQHNAVPNKDVLSAASALAQATAAAEQASAAREQTLRRLTELGLDPNAPAQQVVLRSPLAGKILDLSVVPGEYRNDTSMPVMTVADLGTVWVTSDVPESYIRFVQVGERLEISLVAYPGETFDARVARIADVVDSKTRTVKVQAEMLNPSGRLRPQMYGTIHHIESQALVPALPAAAVIQDGTRTVVFVETAPGRFEERDIAIGKRSGEMVRVLRGLTSGESVVVDGAMLLKGMASAV
jgi:cobalt-zinc-cadmium efflux system membrane fusion protein